MVRSGTTDDVVPTVDEPLPRHVLAMGWYETAKAIGLEYGTAFCGLDEIIAGTVELWARATVMDFDDTTRYAAHLVLLD